MENKKTHAAYALAAKREQIMKTDFYINKNNFGGEKKKRLRRTHWPQNKTNYQKLILTPKTHFIEKKKSACGVRTGRKQKRSYEKLVLTLKKHIL